MATATAEPYFLGLNRRAMVSLGPMPDRDYCAYQCSFCYARGPYQRYARRVPAEIEQWLLKNEDEYDIVYISGDTDSFAPDGADSALDLMRRVLDLGKDLLFTTRHCFSKNQQAVVAELADKFRAAGKTLIPCISIVQLRHPDLELGIPRPEARRKQIEWLGGELQLPVVLTIRPFIPYIDAEEYVEIARTCGAHATVVLGGDLYVDEDGIIDNRIRMALGRVEALDHWGDSGQPVPLDSTNSSTPWYIWKHPDAEESVRRTVEGMGKEFFMRSAEAVDHIRGFAERLLTHE